MNCACISKESINDVEEYVYLSFGVWNDLGEIDVIEIGAAEN